MRARAILASAIVGLAGTAGCASGSVTHVPTFRFDAGDDALQFEVLAACGWDYDYSSVGRWIFVSPLGETIVTPEADEDAAFVVAGRDAATLGDAHRHCPN